MQTKHFSSFAVTLFVSFLMTAPVLAHHGNAAFDETKKVTVKGAVVEWFWANPHCLLKFDVKGENGNVVHWVAETSNPPDMINRGWRRDSLTAGDEVTVTLTPVKNGQPIGRIQQVVLANGHVLGTQPPRPADSPAKPY